MSPFGSGQVSGPPDDARDRGETLQEIARSSGLPWLAAGQAALASSGGYGGEHALEPRGPFAADKAERDQPSCEGSRTDGDTDKPPGADNPVRYRQPRLEAGAQRAIQGTDYGSRNESLAEGSYHQGASRKVRRQGRRSAPGAQQ
jgi:hypothetical protein